MHLDRSQAQHIDPRLTDGQILRAILDPARVAVGSQLTPAGTMYRIYGYTYPISGGGNVRHEDLNGVVEMALLLVVYLDARDRGVLAYVAYAMEADDEEFAQYG